MWESSAYFIPNSSYRSRVQWRPYLRHRSIYPDLSPYERDSAPLSQSRRPSHTSWSLYSSAYPLVLLYPMTAESDGMLLLPGM